MINRRSLLGYGTALVGALMLSGTVSAQSGIQLDKLNFLELRVSDMAKSLAFYQKLFGMPVQSRSEDRVFLKLGPYNQYLALRPVRNGERPAITHYGFSVKNFDLDDTLAQLKVGGFRQIAPPDITVPGIENPMTTWVSDRGGVPTLYLSDERGLVLQLTDSSWCAGTGALGNVCGKPEAVAPGSMALSEINHFTAFVNGGERSSDFFLRFFDLKAQAYQATTPSVGIGDGKQFVMFAGGQREGSIPANVHHASFNMEGFMVDDVLLKLEDNGVTPQNGRPLGPLMHYISLRMPERGGAEGGTPEVYFTDVDGILLQLQDISYCGGGDYLGSKCLP